MPEIKSRLLKSSLAVLAVSLAGTGISCASTSAVPLIAAAANFATNVAGGFGTEYLNRLGAVCFSSTSRSILDQNTVLRSLRRAQLAALKQLHIDYDRVRVSDPNNLRLEQGNRFSQQLKNYLKHEERRVPTLTVDDLFDTTASDADAFRQKVIERAPKDFSSGLSTRHGFGPALEAFRFAAQASMLAELSAAISEKVPTFFERMVVGGTSGADGWFALFVSAATKSISADSEFAAIWTAEQSAVIAHLAETANAKISDLTATTHLCVEELRGYSGKLDAIAGGTGQITAILRDIDARLGDNKTWLSVETRVSMDGLYRFAPRNLNVPFVGRQQELAALYGFLRSSPIFSWWVAAAPGGGGKTRLALELCYRANVEGWQVGFLAKSKPDIPVVLPSRAWRPSKPMLIIADYASEQIELVASLAVLLSHLPSDGANVVRLLLLERQSDVAFVERLLGPSDTDGALLAESFYTQRPEHIRNNNKDFKSIADGHLKVPELSNDEIWEIVKNCPWRSERPPLGLAKEAFLQRFQKIDVRRRVLTAMLLADTLVDMVDDTPANDLDEVLDRLIWRERVFFWPKILGHKASAEWTRRVGTIVADPFIACATMMGTLTGSVLEEIGQEIGLESVSGELIRACSSAIGSPVYEGERRLDGIQPDLIGEYFALRTLAAVLSIESPFHGLPEILWRSNELAMAGFVTRALQNFPEHPALPQVAIPVKNIAESWWVYALYKSHEHKSPAKKLQAAFSLLREASSTDDGAKRALTWLAKAAAPGRSFGDIGENQREEIIRSLLVLPNFLKGPIEHIGDIARVFRDNIFEQGSNADFELCDATLDGLRNLITAHPTSNVIREILGDGLQFRLFIFGEVTDPIVNEELINELREISRGYLDNATLRSSFAQGLMASQFLAQHMRVTARSNEMLCELRAIVNLYPRDTDLVEIFALALSNSIDPFSSDEFPDCLKRLDELREIANSMPTNSEIQMVFVLALGSMCEATKTHNRGRRQYRRMRSEIFRQLDSFRGAEDFENLSATLMVAIQVSDLEEAISLLDEMRQLSMRFPNEQPVCAQFSISLSEILIIHAQLGDFAWCDLALQELRRLSRSNIKDPFFRSILSYALWNFMYYASNETLRCNSFLVELRQIQNAHQNEFRLPVYLAYGLRQMLEFSEFYGISREQIILFTGELNGLSNNFPKNVEISDIARWASSLQ